MKNSNYRSSYFLIPIVVVSFARSQLFAWGQYGHQQVNSAAIDLVGKTNPMGKCFDSARDTVVRYAITPDIEWKMDLVLKTLTPKDASKRAKNDKCEHPLHFFEADSYIKNPQPGEVQKLPSDAYTKVYPEYAQLLAKNAAYVQEVDPSKTVSNPVKPDEVLAHGTAPWRAVELYNLGVKALKNKDIRLAIYYLGTMGHYIGDMSQPFHATLNFDGGYYPAPQDKTKHPHEGIHHEIDTGLLPAPPKKENDVFANFDETAKDVTALGEKYLSQLQTDLPKSVVTGPEIVQSMLKTVDSGFAQAEAMLSIYTRECNEANGVAGIAKNGSQGHVVAYSKKDSRMPNEVSSSAHHKKAPPVAKDPKDPNDNPTSGHGGHGPVPVDADHPAVSGDPYCLSIKDPGKSRAHLRAIPKEKERDFAKSALGHGSVFQAIEARLALSAALLARVWMSAYEDAGKPALGDCQQDAFKFNQSYAIQHYPKPDYYPSGAAAACFANGQP